jgi:hypothetical protein
VQKSAKKSKGVCNELKRNGIGRKLVGTSERRHRRGGRKALGLKYVTPVFFVSVASKGFSQTVSLLFATLAGRSISVAAKGFRETGG